MTSTYADLYFSRAKENVEEVKRAVRELLKMHDNVLHAEKRRGELIDKLLPIESALSTTVERFILSRKEGGATLSFEIDHQGFAPQEHKAYITFHVSDDRIEPEIEVRTKELEVHKEGDKSADDVQLSAKPTASERHPETGVELPVTEYSAKKKIPLEELPKWREHVLQLAKALEEYKENLKDQSHKSKHFYRLLAHYTKLGEREKVSELLSKAEASVATIVAPMSTKDSRTKDSWPSFIHLHVPPELRDLGIYTIFLELYPDKTFLHVNGELKLPKSMEDYVRALVREVSKQSRETGLMLNVVGNHDHISLRLFAHTQIPEKKGAEAIREALNKLKTMLERFVEEGR